MSIQKSTSIVLSTTPFRESSLLVALFSSNSGRLQGIAKGIRSAGKRSIPLERGMLIEHVVYTKSTREIQTLADIQIVDFFPEIRGDIEKTAVRDCAFELLLASVKVGDHGPDLFSLVKSFLTVLCTVPNHSVLLLSNLWNFHFDFAALMGFAHNFSCCLKCNSPVINLTDGGYLIHEQGGLCCPKCGKSRINLQSFIPPPLLSNITNSENSMPQLKTISSAEWIRLIRLASTYCRVHLDFKYSMRSLDFLEEVFS